MGIKTYKDKNGKRMVKGAPAGAWAIWVLAILVMIINIPITVANPIVGIIIFIIMSLLFFIGRKYAEVARIKASRKALITECKELEKLEDEDWVKLKDEDIQKMIEQKKKEKELEEQNKDKIEFEEFKKWKEQQAINQKDGSKSLEPIESESKEFGEDGKVS